MILPLYYCDHHSIPLPPGHKFPTAKYALLREALAADGRFDLTEAPFADPHDIELAHDSAYVRAILNGSVDARIMRRIGFPWSEQLVRRTLASVGGTVAAARRALGPGNVGSGAAGRVAGNLAGAPTCVSRRGLGVLRIQRYRGGDPLLTA